MRASFAVILVIGEALLSTVGALPLQIRAGECPVGQAYYVCANGYKGCFSSDVCSLPAINNDSPKSDNDSPAQSSPGAEEIRAACPTTPTTLTMPEMHNIYMYPGTTPFPSHAKSLSIYKRIGDGGSEQQQVAVFKGIPSLAKRCTIGAQIAADRSFSVYDHGLMDVKLLTKIPEGDVTVDTIRGLDSDKPANQFNFQFWPETPGPRVLNRIDVDCAPELAFRFSMADEIVPGNGGSGAVNLEQDANNGFFLEYSC